MSASLRHLISLSVLFCIVTSAQAASNVPELLPLQAKDLPQECGCIYGVKKDVPLIFWSWENDKQNGVLREAAGARKLTMRSEKYFPAQHEPARPGDRMTLQLASADWSVQTVSEVTASCSAKTKTCHGTRYRSRLILQWQGRNRTELQGWGYCGC